MAVQVRAAVAAAVLFAAMLRAAAFAAGDDPPDPRRRKGELEVVRRAPEADAGEALFAAAELARAGGAFFDGLFARGLTTDAAMRAATIEGAEAEARAVVARHILFSRVGLPLHASDWARQETARRKASGGSGAPTDARDFVDMRLRTLARAAGLAALPKGLRPVYAEAAERPVSPGGKEPAALAIDAGALGWGLLAEVRLGARLAAQRRPGPGGAADYIGDTAERGFEGLLLLTCAAAKVHALKTAFATDGQALGPAPLADYDPFAAPRYFPRMLLVSGDVEAPAPALAVSEKASDLGDAAALLLGAIELARLADPARSPETASLFGSLRAADVREEVFSPALAGAAKELAKFIFRSLVALHFDPGEGRYAFVAEAAPGARGERVGAFEAGVAVLALEALVETFADDVRLAAEAKKLLEAQAKFFIDRMRKDGGIDGGFGLGEPGGAPEPASLAGEMLALRALLAAFRATDEERFSRAAAALARSLERRRYDPWAHLYLGEAPGEFELGVRDGPAVLAALRELEATLGAPEALARFRDVHAALARAGALPGGDGACAPVVVRIKR